MEDKQGDGTWNLKGHMVSFKVITDVQPLRLRAHKGS